MLSYTLSRFAATLLFAAIIAAAIALIMRRNIPKNHRRAKPRTRKPSSLIDTPPPSTTDAIVTALRRVTQNRTAPRVTVIVHSRECGHCKSEMRAFEKLPDPNGTKFNRVLFVEAQELMSARQSELASAQSALLESNAVPMHLVYDRTADERTIELRAIVGQITPFDDATIEARINNATPQRIDVDA